MEFFFSNSFLSLKSRIALSLVFAIFLLQPVGKAMEVPFALLALGGIVQLLRQPRGLWEIPQAKNFGLLVLLFFLPVIFSCWGAVNLQKSAMTALVSLRLLLAGWWVVQSLEEDALFRKLDGSIGLVILIWLLDGVYEAVVGHALFGEPVSNNKLGGVFIHHPLKFGMMTAVFSPFLLVAAVRRGPIWIFPALLLAGGVVFLSGSRGAWIAFGVVAAGQLSHQLLVSRTISLRQVCIVLASLLVLGGVGYQVYSPLRAKVDQTLLVFRGNETAVNEAITYRVPIWRTGWRMFLDHPINGVGARGFRYGYADSALTRDLQVEPDSTETGAYHAHQLLLDIAANTGSLGLLGLGGIWIVLIRLWVRAARETKERMLPYALSLLAVFFPFNTHFATYSSSWSATIFLLIALFCAAASPDRSGRAV